MDSRLMMLLGYGAVFAATVLWIGHHLWFRGRPLITLAAQGSSVLAVLLLTGGLVLYGVKVGYWPFYTAYEMLHVGLLGLLLASLTLLSLRRDGHLLSLMSVGASLVAAYGLVTGRSAVPASLVYDSGWWKAYVALSSFGGGAMLVAGVAAIVDRDRNGECFGRVVAQRALAWASLTVSAGLASGAWGLHRLSGRYWGDARWASVVVAGLLGVAAWHGRREWHGRSWRSVVVGIILCLVGGYVVLGMGGV